MVANDYSWLTYKEQGNEDFKLNRLKEAIEQYTEAIKLCAKVTEQCVVYRNRAACHLKLEHYDEVIVDTDFVLKHQPGDVKALFRR